MYAIVATGGKQYRVAKDDVFTVERLDAEIGSSVELPVLMLADGDQITVDAATLASTKVTAEVVEQTRGAKLVIFKFKKRKGYKRTKGHRQELTVLRVTEIPGADAKPAAKKAAPKKTAKAEAAPEVVEETVAVEAVEAVEAVAEKPKRTRTKKAEAVAETETETAEAPEAESAESAE